MAPPASVRFRDLVDVAVVDEMLTLLHRASGIPSVIEDLDGTALAGAGWQRICGPRRAPRLGGICPCAGMGEQIAEAVESGRDHVTCECVHGLIESCCPVVIAGEHVANVFTGQLLREPLTSERLDEYRERARRCGCDAEAFVAGVGQLPVFPPERHTAMLGFLAGLTAQIAEMGLNTRRVLEQAREAEASEARFRLLMDSLDAIIYVADMETYEVLFINKRGRDLLGEVTGQRCWESIQRGQTGPCDFCTNHLLLGSDRQPKGPYVWEFRNTLIDRWFHLIDRAIRWTDGRLVRIEIATDITEQKEAERSQRELEAQLRQAQKMSALGTMAGGIAHDFNNVLSIILGNAQLLAYDIDAEHPHHESVAYIVNAANRAKEVVAQILTFSRQEAGEKEVTLLGPVVLEHFKTIRATVPSSVEVEVQVESEVAGDAIVGRSVLVDPVQVHQILLNLCANAVHAMHERGRLRVEVRQVDTREAPDAHPAVLEPGIYARLTVADDGCGIDPGIRDRIFEPFYTTKAPGQGTGMGLAVVHGVVQNHGGTISVDSALGQGATFHVYLPTLDAEPKGAVIEEATIPTGREHILVVDDEQAILLLVRKQLEALGYRVSIDESPVSALARFRVNPGEIDAVITDQTMPVMTGAELAVAMLGLRPGLPVLLATGYSNLITAERAMALGIHQLLFKPVSQRKLAFSLRQALDDSAGRRSGDAEGDGQRAPGDGARDTCHDDREGSAPSGGRDGPG